MARQGLALALGFDELGFDEFFSANHDELLRYCWGLTIDRELAQDVAQESMCRAFADWDRISAQGSNPVAWLRTVALNLVRSQWRRDQVAGQKAVHLQLAEHGRAAQVDRGNDPALGVDIDRALAALPDRQREAVVLFHLLDLSVAEAAEIMDVGESTVKVHLQRARAAMAVTLQEES
jgi:RNA polymerase sigma-70 factor (ECF subfamily)